MKFLDEALIHSRKQMKSSEGISPESTEQEISQMDLLKIQKKKLFRIKILNNS